MNHRGLPWWSGYESTCQCKRHRFDTWSRKMPHAARQLSLCTTSAGPNPWTCTPQREAPPQPQWDAHVQQWKPGAAKINLKKIKIKLHIKRNESQGFSWVLGSIHTEFCDRSPYLYLFGCTESVVARGISDLHSSTQDLVPWPGIEPGPSVCRMWSLSHWTTKGSSTSPHSGVGHIPENSLAQSVFSV